MVITAQTFSAYGVPPTAYFPLAVGFVTPAFFVAGLALAAIPIVIHILNRRRFKTVQWAAMEFLLRAMRRNRRRLKFEQWMLLAVRCLVLALVGLALARPFGCGDSSIAAIAGSRSGLHVFVIDNSYSMAYEAGRPEAKTHLEQARLMAKAMIDRLSAGGESVAVVTAGRPSAAVIAAPSYDLEAAKGAIDRIEQSANGTDVVGALQKALEIGRAESGQPRRHLYLFTDATHSAWQTPRDAEALAQLGPQLAGVFRVTHFNLGKSGQWNQGVTSLRPASNLVTSRFNADFLARYVGYGSAADATVQWRLDGQSLPGAATLKLDGEIDRPQSLPALGGGPRVVSTTVASDDRLDVDDTRARVVNVASELKVLIVEGERGPNRLGGSGAFLALALAPPKDPAADGAGNTDSYVQPELISDLELGNKVLAEYRAVILAGVGQLQPGQADQLQHFVREGGTLMVFMGEQVSGENYNATLLPRGLMPGPMTKRVIAASDQRPFGFDFRPRGVVHPLLREFAGQERTGLDTADVYSYWQVDVRPNAGVERVLNFVQGADRQPVGSTTAPAAGAEPGNAAAPAGPGIDPAITVHSVGEGRVLFVATSGHPDSEWTMLPAKPNYVALVHELLLGTVQPGDAWLNLTVGESLVVPPNLRLSAAPTLTDPQQREIAIDQSPTAEGRAVYRSRPLARPGVYTLSTGTRDYPVAVNVPPDEADVRVLNDAALRRALGDIEIQLEADQLPAEAVVTTAGDDYGWGIMLAVLALVGVEAFLAMRFGHFRR